LDYVIFRVKPLLQSIGRPPIVRIRHDDAAVTGGMPLQIIHHPLSRIKHLTEQRCEVLDPDFPGRYSGAKGVRFSHSCDTEGGSSGAPVFDRDWNVVGLHHAGHLNADRTCDGKNKAIKIGRILDSLPQTLKQEILNWQQ
jgi:hypothetical protein